MPRTPSATNPSERFQSIFDKALKAYTKKTENNLLSLPLFREIDACESPEDILNKLRDQIPGFDKPGSSDASLSKWLIPIVNVLYAFSATLGEGVGLVFSPGKVVFAGVGVLLLAAKDVATSLDVLIDVFRRVESFLRRLETYTHVPLSDEMTDVIVNIMAEVLSILAIATRDMKQGRGKRFVRKLMGKTDIEDALGRLDKLTQDEVRMAVAQNLKTTHQSLDVANTLTGNDLRQKLRQWLSPPDPSVNYNTACSLHHKGTAEWFTEGPVFAEWKESGSLLWIHGNPGSGKTVLSSAIIRNIKRIANTGSAHVAYFFFDFKDVGKQECRDLLSSILHQLCDQSLPCLDILSRLYSTHHHGSEQPGDDALRHYLKDMLMIAEQVPIYLVIDALDESPNTRGVPSPRRKVLELVKELVELKLPNLRLCVTSRHETDIRIVLEPLTPTSLSLHNQKGQNKDIVDYVTSVVYSDPELNMRGWREEDKELVITTLSNKAGGMFRWVHCQVEILRQCFARNLRRTLDELPETLDATYERILREIPKQNRDEARRLLQCLTVAVRPIRVEELAEVLAVDFTSREIPELNVDSRWGDQEHAILLACSSLIAIVEDYDPRLYPHSRFVQFSHFSVKEFLTSERLAEAKGDTPHYHIRLEPAHTVMAQACLAVLFRLDYSISRETIKSFPLAEYAVENFSKHAEFENVLTQIPDAVDYLLDTEKPHFAAWLWALNTLFVRGIPQPGKRAERPKTVPLYYVAEFGFSGLVQHILSKRPQDINAKGGDCGTALHVAVDKGHAKVLKRLLAHCVDVDVRGIEGKTPLHLASKKGYVDIGQQLLDRDADVYAQDNNHWTPLHIALSQWSVEAAKPFERGASVQVRNNDSQTPHLALKSGYHDMVRLLLDRGADVDGQDGNHSTPLHLALSQLNVKAVKLFVECGANVQLRNNNGETPLHLASKRGYPSHDTMRLLLDQGADVDAQDDNHSTPLQLALSQGNVMAAKLLVECGASIRVRDNNGQTPLHLASNGGYHDAMRLLLDQGADVDALDNNHSTPLHLASSQWNVKAVKLLVECGANVQVRNNNGEMPLHLALKGGYHDTMRLLLDQGADVDAQDDNRLTPLQLALSQLNVKAAKLPVKCGANVHVWDDDDQTPLHLRYDDTIQLWDRGADNNHSTPLHLALSQRNVEAAKLLVECGANVQVRNNNGQTLLHLASKRGYIDTMRLLLDQGADVDARDDNRSTPLHLASSQRKVEVAKLLVECGANIQVQNNKGQTPLHLASQGGYHNIMRLLLDRGADVDAQDDNHSTPLHLASSKWEVKAAKLLVARGANVQVRDNNGQMPPHPSSLQPLRAGSARDSDLMEFLFISSLNGYDSDST